MRKAFQAIRFSVVGVCLVSIVMAMAGCTEAFMPIATAEHGNVTTAQMAAAEAGDTLPVQCIGFVGGLIPVETAPAGTFVTAWNSPTDSLAVDNTGNVFVFDNRNYRIQKFDKDGHFIAKWGSVGSGDGQFGSGYHDRLDYGMSGGVTVGLGVVYVLDARNNRIQKFCGGL